MRSLGRVDRVAAGAVGPPGRRTFYLEVVGPAGTEWFVVEKEQLATLAAHGLELIGEPPEASPASTPSPAPQGEPSFRVGEIGLGADEGEMVVLLSPTEETGTAEPVAFTVGAADFAAMARLALAVVAAGRPVCRLCGHPMDPEGHSCPGGNGDLRRR